MPTVDFQLGGTLKFLTEPESHHGAVITVQHGGFICKAWGDGMSYVLPNTNAVKVRIEYVDAKGNPAVVDGDVKWNSSNTDIATVQVDADDTQNAVIAAASDIGQVQINAAADADIGTGTRVLVTTLDVDVVAGEAVAGTITPVGESTPIEPQPVR